MQDVSDEFAMIYPDVPLTVQENGMDEDAREAFLAQFSADRPGTLVGFCVLGGIFAEGIDLAGDRLIGSIIVGVGLPQIGVEQNALRDYYEDTMGMGFEYAYQYPGMNKVLRLPAVLSVRKQTAGSCCSSTAGTEPAATAGCSPRTGLICGG